ncbi:hypothetical protein M413DRAFT_443273 [Hebeloma cylindrosporum]|uniref:Uncharacterized protein n=1 Tax=Hebeloma cylindrosporum TaxID=76867 RepID=A0A0C2YTC6_HEBCY|nr:hypothetical protein M413DRAFT_443273 [Hebeloma cylindrosporum h7]
MASLSPRTTAFLMAKQSFLNAVEDAKRRAGRFTKAQKPDERDKVVFGFIKSVVRGLPSNAEEIPQTRQRIMSRRIRRVKIVVASSDTAVDPPAAPTVTEPSNDFPSDFLHAATSTSLAPPSSLSPAPALTPQTPTAARCPIPDAMEVIVEKSATGQGTHTIWRYPGDEARPEAAPINPTTAVYTSLPGVIVKPSATGLGTHTIWVDTADPAPVQAQEDVKPSVDLHNLSDTVITSPGRRVVVRDPRSSSPFNSSSSDESRLLRSREFRTRYRSPTPYPMATRPAPLPSARKPETPEAQKSKKRSREGDDDEAPRPKKRGSQESLFSNSPSVARSRTPTRGSPSPFRFERGRSTKRVNINDILKDN